MEHYGVQCSELRIRHSQDFGTLEPGKAADLVILDADPAVCVSDQFSVGVVSR
jgi:imidazolonepropionase-like amidohydrolase